MLNYGLTLDKASSTELDMLDFCSQNGLCTIGSKHTGIDYVVAMTSYPKRIHSTYKTILSLLNQDKNFIIILCLSKEEFPSIDFVPATLRELYYAANLDIIFCEKNLKIFKKSLYVRKMFPKLPVLTVDDDWWYREDFCDIMWSMYRAFEDSPRIISWDFNQYFCKDRYISSGTGYGMFYPPSEKFTEMYERLLTQEIIDTTLDDEYNSFIAEKLGIKYHYVFPSATIEPGIKLNNVNDCHNDVYWVNRMFDDRERVFDLCEQQYQKYYGTLNEN